MTKLFLAGACPKFRAEVEGHNLLLSYADSTQFRFARSLVYGQDEFCNNFRQLARGDRMTGWKVSELILDSGAFSIWTSRRYAGMDPLEVAAANARQLEAYIDDLTRIVFNSCYNHGRNVKTLRYVALDVIPGEPGAITAEQIDQAMELSLSNLHAMRRAGLNPMPVYHEGDPSWVLEAFVAERQGEDDVICLAGTVSRGRPELRGWVEEIVRRFPTVRFHGLAMTQGWASEVGLYSVDSSTWLNEQKTPVGDDRLLTPAERRRKGVARVASIFAPKVEEAVFRAVPLAAAPPLQLSLFA